MSTTIDSTWLKGFCIAIGGVIVFSASCTLAQITPDTTLPNNSRVNTSGNTINIEGGTQAGSNLFHSFQEFSVLKDTTANFRNAADIQNIISRVTGNSISNIDGLIRANGTANLFLINPNGIIFGQNARLDIGGSFVATSANSMKFADGYEFKAKNSQPTPLLTINVPVGLQFGSNAGNVSLRGSSLQVNPGRSLALIGGNMSMDGGKLVAPGGRVELGGVAGENTVGLFPIGDFFGLNFPQGVPRADVSLTNQAEVNVLSSSGGSIAVNAASLNLSGGSGLLTGISGVGSPNTQAGDIKINATGIVAIADRSKISNEVTQNAVGNSGNISVNADSIFVSNHSFLAASTQGEGNAGNVTVNTGLLSVIDDAFLAASANGQGDAGNININARNTVSFDNGARAYTDVNRLPTSTTQVKGDGGEIKISTGSLFVTDGAQLNASSQAKGNAGNVTINTGSLSVTGGAFLAASANGQGDAGNITVDAGNTVFFENGAAYTDVNPLPTSTTEVKGNGGEIKISSGALFVTKGAQLNASSQAEGNAGNITINARTISFDGGRANTDIGEKGKGQAGNFNIFNTESFFVTNGSQLSASTSGVGNAGNIAINTGSLSVNNESFLASSANGQGNAGNITIDAGDTVSFEYGAKAYTDVNRLPSSTTQVKGDGGDITISSGSLFLTKGAQLISNTQALGDAGNITIYTGSLSVTEEAFLASSANGQQGNAGDITVDASDRVLFYKGSAFSNVGVCSLIAVGCTPSNNTIKGNGGNITIKAPSLQLMNNSFLATGVGDDNIPGNVEGNAGNISIDLRDDLSLDQSFITTRLFTNGKGKAGNIDIRAGLVFSYQSLISASTQGQGNAGGVSVQTTGAISLADSDISTAVQKGATGDAQGINITARSLVLTDGAQLNAVTSGEGKAGNILINTTDKISVSGTNTTTAPTNLFQHNIPPRFNSPPKFVDGVESGIFTSTNSSGVGGDITVNTNTFSISNGSVVDARTTASGRGGAIKVNTNTFEAMSGGQLSAITSGSGSAGSITLNATDTVTIRDSDPTYLTRLAQFGSDNIDIYGKPKVSNQGAASELTVSSAESGSAGDLTIQANSIRFDNGAKVSADTTGGGGNIFLNSPWLLLRRGSSITTNASGSNISGGNITIDAKNGLIIAVPSADSDIRADSANSRGGNVTIENAAGIFGIQSRKEPSPQNDITAKGATPDLSGNVQINTFNIEPSEGLVELPTQIIDPASLIANSCIARRHEGQGSFIITGTGGLPTQPDDPASSSFVTYTVPSRMGRGGDGGQGRLTTNHYSLLTTHSYPMVEATGIYHLASGQQFLGRRCP